MTPRPAPNVIRCFLRTFGVGGITLATTRLSFKPKRQK